LLRGRAGKGFEGFERFFGGGKVDVDHRFAARWIAKARAQSIGKDVRHVRVEELDSGIHGAANRRVSRRAEAS